MEKDPSRDFDSWARTSAALRDRTEQERAGILQRLGLAQRWEQIETQWAKTLLDDVSTGNLERIMRYGDACVQERTRRSRGEDPYGDVATQPTAQPQTASQSHPQPETAPQPVSGDFRHDLHSAQNAPRSFANATAARQNFAAVVNPQSPAPQRPHLNQAETAAASVVDVVRSTTAAMGWSLERYADFHAALSRTPHDRGTIAQQFGVAAEAIDAIVKGWNKRIAADAALQAQFAALSAARLGRG